MSSSTQSVLVVEDEASIASFVSLYLKNAGYEVRTATNGADALVSVQSRQPSLIVPIYMNMLALATPNGLTAVAFRFKAEGLQKNETLSISGLYVDPFSSR